MQHRVRGEREKRREKIGEKKDRKRKEEERERNKNESVRGRKSREQKQSPFTVQTIQKTIQILKNVLKQRTHDEALTILHTTLKQ